MDSLKWLEFDTFSREITKLEDHLRCARTVQKSELMRRLEQRLRETESCSERLLAAIGKASTPSGKAPVPYTNFAYRIG
jgi:hypothetical protein